MILYLIFRFVILLSTSSLQGYGIHRIFSFAQSAGFDGLDLVLQADMFDGWDANYIKQLSDTFSLPVLSITAPNRGMNEGQVEKILEMAHTLQAQVVTFSPPHIGDGSSTWFSKSLPKIQKKEHISIAVKNVEPKLLFFVISEYKNAALSQIKKVTGSTALDLAAIDPSSSLDIIKAQSVLGNSIKNVYIADKDGPKRGLLPGTAGGGTSFLPIESLFMKLKTAGYDGFMSLKVDPKELGVGEENAVMVNLETVLEYYKKHFTQYK